MLDQIPLGMYREWQAYAVLEPFDEDRADLRTADIVRAIFNVVRDIKKYPDPFRLDDVRLRWEGTPPPVPRVKTPEELEQVGKQWAMLFGAKVT